MDDRLTRKPGWALFWQPYLAALLGALVLLIPTAINRSPLYFVDTQSYVRMAAVPIDAFFGSHISAAWKRGGAVQASQEALRTRAAAPPGKLANKGVTANRSIYYGALAVLGYLSSNFRLLVALQALLAAFSIAVPWFRICGGGPIGYFAIVAAVTLGTPLALFVGFVMPDVFAGLLILSVATVLGGWSRLHRADRWALLAIGALAVLVHNSHLAIVGGILSFVLVIPALRREAGRASILAVSVLLLVALAGQIAFSMALRHATGATPLLLPHISAHLVDRGPGSEWLKENCGKVNFTICQFKDRLPVYWEDFLGNGNPDRGVFAVADMPTKRKLSSEQTAFALAVFRDEPVALSSFLAAEAGRQLVGFSMNGFVAPDQLAYVASHWPADLAAASEQSLFARRPAIVRGWSTVVYIVAGASLLLIALLVSLRRAALDRACVRVVEVALLGVVANALVCGILASPYDRFQARVVWLLFLCGALLLRTYRVSDAPGRIPRRVDEDSRSVSPASRSEASCCERGGA